MVKAGMLALPKPNWEALLIVLTEDLKKDEGLKLELPVIGLLIYWFEEAELEA